LAGWYRRTEFGLRAAIFFSAATVSGAFGGLLSAAIANMDGVGGYEGWRWIFILIGLATVCVGILSIWLCEDFPEDAKFLSPEEREFIVHRLQSDQKFSAAGEKFKWDALFKAIVDWKTWVGMMIYAGVDGALYAFSIFTPTIVKQLGYTSTRANLLSVPIYAFACLITIAVGFFADRKGNRAMINCGMIAIGIVGYIILITSRLPGLSYFAIYLAAAGIYPCIPNTIALTSTSIEGVYKRSVVMAWIVSFGNINGAATTNAYRSKDSPHYTLGHGVIILYLAVGFLSTVVYYFGLRRSNARRKSGRCDETILADDRASASTASSSAQPDLVAHIAATNNNEVQADESLLREAAQARYELEQSDRKRGLFGKIHALRRRFGEADGGVYATGAEARAIKGDAYSKFYYAL
jgi:MFS family permease